MIMMVVIILIITLVIIIIMLVITMVIIARIMTVDHRTADITTTIQHHDIGTSRRASRRACNVVRAVVAALPAICSSLDIKRAAAILCPEHRI